MPAKKTDNTTKHKAVQLRHEPTLAEVKLWRYLRADRLDGLSFRRQHAIGPFIMCHCERSEAISSLNGEIATDKKPVLAMTMDGGHHVEQEEYDQQRTAFLESQGYRVLRFWNNDVLNNIEGVIISIQGALLNQSPQS
jgi:very-short-patch-repair endonuclease